MPDLVTRSPLLGDAKKVTGAAWEDGFRTRPGGPGTFEWWHFDAVLDDGSTLVINFLDKDIRSGGGINQPARPMVTFELDGPDGTHVQRARVAHDAFAFGADRCDVRVGANTFVGDLHTYRIHVGIDGVTADVILTGQVFPGGRRPGTSCSGTTDRTCSPGCPPSRRAPSGPP